MAPSEGFPTALRAWRGRAGVSQAELDGRIGRSAGTIAQIELGRLRPPDRAGCARIAVALGVSEREVWLAAREHRLRQFDEEIYADIVSEREQSRTPLDLDEDETDLIRQLRAIDDQSGKPRGQMAEHLADLALLVLGDAGPFGHQAPWALARAMEMRQPRLRRLLSAIVRVVETVVDERAPTGE